MTDLEKLANKRINLVAKTNKFHLSFIETIFFIVLFAAIAVFAKYAVYDPIIATQASTLQVNQAQSNLDKLIAANAGKDDLAMEYSKYIIEAMTEEEQELVDRSDVVDVLRTKAMILGSLSSVVINGNSVTITYFGVDLNAASALVESIKSDERVSHVSVTSTASKGGSAPTAIVVMTMKSPGDTAKVSSGSASTGGTTSTSAKGANNG